MSDTDPTIQQTIDLLKLREGVRTTVYLDSLGKPTVGVGHLVLDEDDLSIGDKIPMSRVDSLLVQDMQSARDAAVSQMTQAGITDRSFLPYLTSVCFQLGEHWTYKFPHTWGVICRGDYESGANMLDSTAWAAQTPVRVQDFQEALRRLPPKTS